MLFWCSDAPMLRCSDIDVMGFICMVANSREQEVIVSGRNLDAISVISPTF